LLGINMDLESVTKIIISVILIYFIKNVYGAVIGMILGFMAGLLVGGVFIKRIFLTKRKSSNIQGIYSYSWPAMILFSALIIMFSMDIIIAKALFSPEVVGQYAVASMLGKMIFFGTNGIGKAMFPISSETKGNEKKRKILKKSLLIIGFLCFFALLVFLIFPELLINILFGSKYLEIAGIIFYSGLAYSILSITNLLVLHKLAQDKIKMPYFMFMFIILGIALLLVFKQSLKNFALALIMGNVLMLIGSFFIRSKK